MICCPSNLFSFNVMFWTARPVNPKSSPTAFIHWNNEKFAVHPTEVPTIFSRVFSFPPVSTSLTSPLFVFLSQRPPALSWHRPHVCQDTMPICVPSFYLPRITLIFFARFKSSTWAQITFQPTGSLVSDWRSWECCMLAKILVSVGCLLSGGFLQKYFAWDTDCKTERQRITPACPRLFFP